MTYRVIETDPLPSCDHCGKIHDSSFEDHVNAYHAAKGDGWRLSDWLDKGCPRQTLFCQECIEKLTPTEQPNG